MVDIKIMRRQTGKTREIMQYVDTKFEAAANNEIILGISTKNSMDFRDMLHRHIRINHSGNSELHYIETIKNIVGFTGRATIHTILRSEEMPKVYIAFDEPFLDIDSLLFFNSYFLLEQEYPDKLHIFARGSIYETFDINSYAHLEILTHLHNANPEWFI